MLTRNSMLSPADIEVTVRNVSVRCTSCARIVQSSEVASEFSPVQVVDVLVMPTVGGKPITSLSPFLSGLLALIVKT